jgi:hypothetical protein
MFHKIIQLDCFVKRKIRLGSKRRKWEGTGDDLLGIRRSTRILQDPELEKTQEMPIGYLLFNAE